MVVKVVLKAKGGGGGRGGVGGVAGVAASPLNRSGIYAEDTEFNGNLNGQTGQVS